MLKRILPNDTKFTTAKLVLNLTFFSFFNKHVIIVYEQFDVIEQRSFAMISIMRVVLLNHVPLSR